MHDVVFYTGNATIEVRRYWTIVAGDLRTPVSLLPQAPTFLSLTPARGPRCKIGRTGITPVAIGGIFVVCNRGARFVLQVPPIHRFAIPIQLDEHSAPACRDVGIAE